MTTLVYAADKIGLNLVFDWFKRLDKSLSRYWEINRTIKELSALSDRELYDIGINRSMIRSIAMEIHFDNRETM